MIFTISIFLSLKTKVLSTHFPWKRCFLFASLELSTLLLGIDFFLVATSFSTSDYDYCCSSSLSIAFNILWLRLTWGITSSSTYSSDDSSSCSLSRSFLLILLLRLGCGDFDVPTLLLLTIFSTLLLLTDLDLDFYLFTTLSSIITCDFMLLRDPMTESLLLYALSSFRHLEISKLIDIMIYRLRKMAL